MRFVSCFVLKVSCVTQHYIPDEPPPELLPPELLLLLSGMTACTVPTTTPAAVAATCVTFSAAVLAISPIVPAFSRAVFIMRRALAGAFLAMLRPLAATLRTRFIAPPELRFVDDFLVDDFFDEDFLDDDLVERFDADFFEPEDLLRPDDLRDDDDFFEPDERFAPPRLLFFAMRTLL